MSERCKIVVLVYWIAIGGGLEMLPPSLCRHLKDHSYCHWTLGKSDYCLSVSLAMVSSLSIDRCCYSFLNLSFALLCHDFLFPLSYVRAIHIIICSLDKRRIPNYSMQCSWIITIQVMTQHLIAHAPSNLLLDFFRCTMKAPLVFKNDLLLCCTLQLASSECVGCSSNDWLWWGFDDGQWRSRWSSVASNRSSPNCRFKEQAQSDANQRY
jgi:hypothetical protein